MQRILQTNKIWNMHNGIIYIATGKRHTQEALRSATTAKQHMPDIPITLMSDCPVDHPAVDNHIAISDPHFSFYDKVNNIRHTPYQRTLFLDTDTYICAPVYELFTLLERFDIGLVHDGGFIPIPTPQVPESFPQFNSGVICFRNTDQMQAILAQWEQRFKAATQQYANTDRRAKGHLVDEATLRESLFLSSLSIAPLTSQYNCRFVDGGFVAGPIKILHRRSAHDYETVAHVLNRYQGQRVYIGDRSFKHTEVGRLIRRVVAQPIGTYDKPFLQLISERIQHYVAERGVAGTVIEILRRIIKQPS